jgi:hypothetical protein
MQIQVNTDDNVAGRDALTRRIETEVGNVVGRFADQITRLEIHLGDENAAKSGAQDKRCTIEARLAGRKPSAVKHSADTLEGAWTGAARKLRRSLQSRLGRLSDHKGASSIRKDGI